MGITSPGGTSPIASEVAAGSSAWHFLAGVSVVVPVYRSSTMLAELHARLTAVLQERSSPFELIFVEDCGGDDSWKLIGALAQRDERTRGVRMSRNYGQHNALLCGIRAARYGVTVTIDDDLQHPPEELPRLLDALTGDVDVVYGPPLSQQHGLLRNVASHFTKLALQGAMGVDTARQVSALRVFRTSLRHAFDAYRGPFVNLDVLLTWGTTRFCAVPVRHDLRQSGESGYTVRKLAVHALNMMTGFTTLPLQFASIMGIGFAFFGVVVLLFVVVRYLIEGGIVPGFPFLAATIAIFSGAQLLALGIIGEYLARMHQRTMDRPPYCVSEVTLPSE